MNNQRIYRPIGISPSKKRVRELGVKCTILETDRHLSFIELETGEKLWVTSAEII